MRYFLPFYFYFVLSILTSTLFRGGFLTTYACGGFGSRICGSLLDVTGNVLVGSVVLATILAVLCYEIDRKFRTKNRRIFLSFSTTEIFLIAMPIISLLVNLLIGSQGMAEVNVKAGRIMSNGSITSLGYGILTLSFAAKIVIVGGLIVLSRLILKRQNRAG